jgi:adsorption protein B
MSAADVLPVLLVVAQGLLAVVGLVCLLSGIDDCFLDACFVAMVLRRRRGGGARPRVPTEPELLAAVEQPIAIMVPAWDESTVIGRMVDNILRSVRYSNYHVFVGTYPNDPATQAEVDAVAASFPNVQRVVCPNPGPTCKADCLNWIYQAVLDFERQTGVTFAMFVIHDAEDLPHPLSLKLFNHLVPAWHHFTSGHYLDEFAESHLKDVPVRQWLTGSLPAAGVGCAFSRRALRLVAAHSDNSVFSLDSLTEDYDLGLRLRRFGVKQVFAKIAVERRGGGSREYIATWEYFPTKFSRAVRQKSRWIIGITLQGWKGLGWQGDAWTRYALFRDRKGLLTNQIVMLGYVAVGFVIAVWITTSLVPDAYRYPPVVESGSWLWYLMLANAVFMAERLLQRSLCVLHLYGWRQAVLAVPRQIWSNVVNFTATGRAMRLWARHLVTGRPIAWDKTGHVFPSEAELRRRRAEPVEALATRRIA